MRSSSGRASEPEGPPWLVQLELSPREFALLRSSELRRGAVAWREGMPEWRPVSAFELERPDSSAWKVQEPEPPSPAATQAERVWQSSGSSAPPPAVVNSVTSTARRPLPSLTQVAVLAALVALGALLLIVWKGPVQSAQDAASRAELAVARLTPLVERALTSLEARIAEVSSRAAALASVNSAPQPVATSSAVAPEPAPRPSAAPAPAKPDVSVAAERAQLSRALSVAAARTAACSSGGSGSLRAIVTFGPNGLVRAVSLGAAPAGVDRACVSKVLSSARGRPFVGEPITIKKIIKF